MQIIYLNAWNGRVRTEITNYLKAQSPATDVFCFQEAFEDMQAICADVLSDYAVYTSYKSVTKEDTFPQIIYVRKGIAVKSSDSILQEQPDCGLGLYVEVEHEGKSIFICNFHGMSRPVDKLDNPNRLLQSKTLIDTFSGKERVIIGGDFNSFPETKNIGMFAEAGYRDLIKEFDIKTTRNQLVWDRYPDTKQYYSDYAFISPAIKLQAFVVPDNKISDHLPLEVTIV